MAPTTKDSSFSKEELVNRMEQGFSPIESLWNETSEITEIHGLDAAKTTAVKKNISDAYQSMREARRQLGVSG